MKTELSRREAQVASRIAQGMKGPAIARDLGIGYEGVRNYLRRIRRKKGVSTQAEIAGFAEYAREEETLP